MSGAIGILDSGVGGLTVFKEAMRQLPNESLIYIGDNARCPYGPREPNQILEFTEELAQFLLSQGVKVLVIACNTATALALTYLQDHMPIPVLGVIKPGALAANKYSQTGRIGLIATEGTVKSGYYERVLYKKNPNLQVTSLACPNFVSLVESHDYRSPLAKKLVHQQLQGMRRAKVDTLILGCTHFPLLAPIIQKTMGSGVGLIDSGKETVADLASILDYEDLAAEETQNPQYHFYTTGSTELFDAIASEWLGRHVSSKHINIAEEG